MIKEFYNAESAKYSEKRYTGKADNYVRYFFQKRLALVLSYLHKYLSDKNSLRLLDIGCADGVISRAIDESFPKKFDEIVGLDIATKMIEHAREITPDSKFSFFVKDDFLKNNELLAEKYRNMKFDVILSLGYLSMETLEKELDLAQQFLAEKGRYICTLGSKDSIHARLKLQNEPYYKNYGTYSVYESIISKKFQIERTYPYGLFIPKIWTVPAVAKVIHPFIDAIFSHILPNIFHEKIYVLRRK